VVAGLVALSVTQPVLDLLGRNPEFFVAGRYSAGQIVAFGLVVALGPSVLVASVVVAAGWLHGSVGAVAYRLELIGLGGLLGNVVVRGFALDGGRVAVLAGVVGASAIWAIDRARPGRMLLEMLSAANVFFLVAFLLVSPTSRLLTGGGGDLGEVRVPEPPGPVLVVIFDELPLTTLLRADGSLNADRYPAFATLAERTTWYRNASASHPRTERSVPALLTGRAIRAGELPTHRDLPRNLLGLFATAVPVNRYESITDMCPPSVCAARPRQPLRQALEDATTVFGHRVLPRHVRDRLPAIDTAWGGFGDLRQEEAADLDTDGFFPSGAGGLARWRARDPTEQSPAGQLQALREHGLEIDADPALHLIHVVVPHTPWVLTPWGTQLMGPPPPWELDPAHPAFDASTLLRYQRHSLQVGAADGALGEVLDHLVEQGLWDDTTLVVTADHGTSLLPPDFGREPTEANIEEVMRVPLFIKAPGQQAGQVVDDPALGIDVLPTLIDLLDIETDWVMEGHSLLDGSDASVVPEVSAGIGPVLDLAAHHASRFPLGDDWVGLAAVGDHAELVGSDIDDLELGPPSLLAWAPNQREALSSLPTASGFVPQLLDGLIAGSGDERPPELVVSVNGTVAGVARIHERARSGEGWSFFALLGPFRVHGANEIEAFEVTRGPAGPVLRPLGVP
jgi:hypothetical protein